MLRLYLLVVTAQKGNYSERWITHMEGGAVKRTCVREDLLESKNVSPLNRVYPRSNRFAREQQLFKMRQERAAARSRKGYRWRCHKRELKRIRGCLQRDDEIFHNTTKVETVKGSPGVDSLRREGSDIGEKSTENPGTQTDTALGDMELSH